MRHDAASADAHQRNQEETEMDATTVAVDVAKTVFEVAIANHQWHIVGRHRFNRRQFAHFLATVSPRHVVMEACGTAHYWGRCARQYGHTVTLLSPAYVRPYVRRNKTDRIDAEALLEATRSGQIPSVPVKSVAQQTLVALHRAPVRRCARFRPSWKMRRPRSGVYSRTVPAPCCTPHIVARQPKSQ
jgi:Transposase